MADVQVFFNRPLNPVNLDQLCDDLRSATDRVVIASAWFTDTSIAEAFIVSPAYHKIAVFNQHDLARGSRKAVNMVTDHINDLAQAERQKREEWRLTFKSENPTYFNSYFEPSDLIAKYKAIESRNPLRNEAKAGVVGSKDWQNGIMHHKFIIADDVVWFGSFNFTYNARNNYETLARVDDEDTATFFWIEAQCMVDDECVWEENGNGAHGAFLAACSICGKKMPANMVTYIDSHGGIGCPECAEKTEW